MGEAGAGEKPATELEPGERVAERYTVCRKLGEGGYGAVYEVERGSGKRYACKVEAATEPLQALKMEVMVLQALEKAGALHSCRMIEGGMNEKIRFIVMTMLGPSLQSLRKDRRSQCFSLSTALRVGHQCLEAVKEVHDVGFLHRDLKPANLAIGRSDMGPQGPKTVYLLDFGIARKYRDENGALRKARQRAGFRGTLRYAPLNCHRQKELSRRDDLESWLYLLVELTNGRLPWRELTVKDEVFKAKQEARSPKGLPVLFRHCPDFYQSLLDLIDGMEYGTTPAYERMGQALAWGLEQSPAPHNRPDAPLDWEQPPAPAGPKTRVRTAPKSAANQSARRPRNDRPRLAPGKPPKPHKRTT